MLRSRSSGQTTVPREIVDFLKLNPGDTIDFIIDSDGRVVVQLAKIQVQSLKGILHRMESISMEAMNAAVKQRVY
ncbi:MAG: AbrB family transcriptional regulator [Hormoscilla sp. GM102CHS1]|nr:AbrB family transcriptional regulator [Hormoscilla sp. GM102CHS1]